jgi:N-methylhydantoinase A
MDGMYQGQSWDTRCALPLRSFSADDIEEVGNRFEDSYEAAWGTRLGMPIRVSSFGVVAVGARDRPHVAPIAKGTATPPPEARLDPVQATLRWDNEIRRTTLPIYERSCLLAGNRIVGPALVAQATSTTILHPGDRAVIDDYGNIRITYEEV